MHRHTVSSARSTTRGLRRRLAGHLALFGALVLLRCLPVRFAVTAARAATRLPGRTATVEDAEAAVAAVRRAASWWPGRACLEESLAAHLTAALTGRRVGWVMGARFAPHAAHAWIEAAGHVIGQDEIDRVWPYVPALTVEAGELIQAFCLSFNLGR
ncbi:lasso peptide biosynthesis B2 protein [Streptomyces sp. SID1121]|uniref:lasso peptide biosynthesis B2 protein n=1 Tax=Streptomyces sp. SID1121 TaxID=3425888 RepID=UPI004055CF36